MSTRRYKLLLVTVNNRLKFEIEIKIVHDLSCHPILWFYVLQ